MMVGYIIPILSSTVHSDKVEHPQMSTLHKWYLEMWVYTVVCARHIQSDYSQLVCQCSSAVKGCYSRIYLLATISHYVSYV